MCWQLCIVVIHPLHPVTYLRHFKGGAHILGEFLVVFMTGDLCKLPYQDGICTYLTHHSIQSKACKGEGSESLGIDGGGVMSTSAAGHLPPWCLPGRVPPHPGVAGDGDPAVGDTQDPHPPQPGWSQPPTVVLTNWSFWMVPPQSTTLVETTHRPYLPWHHI